jgi:hypothetical protein
MLIKEDLKARLNCTTVLLQEVVIDLELAETHIVKLKE